MDEVVYIAQINTAKKMGNLKLEPKFFPDFYRIT